MSDTKKNPMIKWFIIHVVVITVLAAGLYMLTKLPKGDASPKNTVVYLVRHAEKVTGETAERDPALTEAGTARAELLAGLLVDANITEIYSSDTIRTRDTAAPTAEMTGVKINIYDPRNLQELAEIIKAAKGHYLVVGHSNTIPETVNALGGVGGSPIFEKSEYDRLYVVTMGRDGTVQTKLRRYGTRYMTEIDELKAQKVTVSDEGAKKPINPDDLAVSTGRISADDKKQAKKQEGENRDARPIKRVPPIMPEIAIQSGYCFMRFDVDTHGRTFNVDAYKCSDDMFANPAADSVREWVYDPKLENGEAVIRKGITSKVTFKLSDEAGDLIEEPKPVDQNINDILPEGQKAKLATKIPKQVQRIAKLPTSNYCCIRYDVSQTGLVFNEDIATCSDFELVGEATKFIRYMKFTPANYNGEKISSSGYTMLIKYYNSRRFNENAPKQMLPAIGSNAEKAKICQFE